MNKKVVDLVPKILACVIVMIVLANYYRLDGIIKAFLLLIAFILIVIPLNDIINDKSSNDAH